MHVRVCMRVCESKTALSETNKSAELPPSWDGDDSGDLDLLDGVDWCCKKRCLEQLDARQDKLREFRRIHESLTRASYTQFIFQLLCTMRTLHGGGYLVMLGVRVCLRACYSVLGISRNRFIRLVKWHDQGHVQPPRDLRHSKSALERAAFNNADGWLRRA